MPQATFQASTGSARVDHFTAPVFMSSATMASNMLSAGTQAARSASVVAAATQSVTASGIE